MKEDNTIETKNILMPSNSDKDQEVTINVSELLEKCTMEIPKALVNSSEIKIYGTISLVSTGATELVSTVVEYFQRYRLNNFESMDLDVPKKFGLFTNKEILDMITDGKPKMDILFDSPLVKGTKGTALLTRTAAGICCVKTTAGIILTTKLSVLESLKDEALQHRINTEPPKIKPENNNISFPAQVENLRNCGLLDFKDNKNKLGSVTLGGPSSTENFVESIRKLGHGDKSSILLESDSKKPSPITGVDIFQNASDSTSESGTKRGAALVGIVQNASDSTQESGTPTRYRQQIFREIKKAKKDSDSEIS